MKCLACWAEISSHDKICPNCGTKQDDIKKFLVLSLLVQKGKKAGGKKYPELFEFLSKIDPKRAEEIEKYTVPVDSSTERKGLKPYVPPTLPTHSSYPPYSSAPTALHNEHVAKQSLADSSTIPVSDSKENAVLIICDKCHKEVPAKRFCKYCGNRLFVECPQCGAEVRSTYKFCPQCGAKIEQEDTI